MFHLTLELIGKIRSGEDSSLGLKALQFRGERVIGPSREAMGDELAAMANTASGVFVLGVDDKTKAIIGLPLEKLDAVEGWVREIWNDLIEPPLIGRIRKVALLDELGVERVIIRLDIPRSLHVHRSPGGYFHRIGSSKRQMPPEVLARLFQQRSQARLVRFDEQAVSHAPTSCLQPGLWGKFRTSFSPEDDTSFLLKLKLLTTDEDGVVVPTVSGILLASERPTDYLPNAFIQAVAYRGTERNAAYQLDAKDFTGPLDRQVLEAYEFVVRNMRVFGEKEPARRDVPQYATSAVFEAIVNAVAHRDYSVHGSKIRLHMFADRLGLFSPGAIPNTMTIDSLPLRQASRNDLITSLLARCPWHKDDGSSRTAWMMDKRGEGVPIILQASQRLSGKLPAYRLLDDAELMLTLWAYSPA